MEINFGVSDYSRYFLGAEWEERIKEIPLCNKLPPIPSIYNSFISNNLLEPDAKKKLRKSTVRNYLDAEERISTKLPAVIFDLITKPFGCQTAFDLYLIWIKERNGWVAFFHKSWYEGGNEQDESEDGPYSLNDYCFNILRQAYCVPPEKSLQEALEMISLELKEEEHS